MKFTFSWQIVHLTIFWGHLVLTTLWKFPHSVMKFYVFFSFFEKVHFPKIQPFDQFLGSSGDLDGRTSNRMIPQHFMTVNLCHVDPSFMIEIWPKTQTAMICVLGMFPVCSRFVLGLFSGCSRFVPSVFSKRFGYVLGTSNCSRNVPGTFPERSQNRPFFSTLLFFVGLFICET